MTHTTASGFGRHIHDFTIERLISVYRRPDGRPTYTPELVALNDILRTRNGAYVRSVVGYDSRIVTFRQADGTSRSYTLPPVYLIGGTREQQILFDNIMSGINRNEQFAAELARIYSGIPANPVTGAPAMPGASEGIFINALDAASPLIPIGASKNTLIGGMAQP